MTFRVGQKVVCIDASPRRGGYLHSGLIEGRIYTIEAFGLTVSGYNGPMFSFNKGWAYLPNRFRPIVERKTDISLLQALLVPGTKILEDAQ